jgi:hypothetical protein
MRNDLRTQIHDWYQQQNKAIKGMFIDRISHDLGIWKPSDPTQSIRAGIIGTRCSAKIAKAIASAWGYPARWPELVIVPTKRGKP